MTSKFDPVRVGIPISGSENRIFEITAEQESGSGDWKAEVYEVKERPPFPEARVSWVSPLGPLIEPDHFDTPGEAIGNAMAHIVDSIMAK